MESREIEKDYKQGVDEMWIDELIHLWFLSENDEFFTLTFGNLEYDRLIEGSLQPHEGTSMHLDTPKKQQQPIKRSSPRLRKPTHKQ
jgi:hypothetical protein